MNSINENKHILPTLTDTSSPLKLNKSKSMISRCIPLLIFILVISSCKNDLYRFITTEEPEKEITIDHVGWILSNFDKLFSNQASEHTIAYRFWIYWREENIEIDDIESVDIYKPYTFPTENPTWSLRDSYLVGYYDEEEKSVGGGLLFPNYEVPNSCVMPIGLFTFMIRLKNGNTDIYELEIPAPGMQSSEKYNFVYNEYYLDEGYPVEDDFVTMLSLPVVNGAEKNPDDETISISFGVDDERAYNAYLYYNDEDGHPVAIGPFLRNLDTGDIEHQLNEGIGFYTNGTENVVTIASSDLAYLPDRSFADILEIVLMIVDGYQYIGTQFAGFYDCSAYSQRMSLQSGVIPVTGVTVNGFPDLVSVGSSVQLAATVSPMLSSNTEVSWMSSDESIATVDMNGLVVANNGGVATISATTVDGGFSDSCDIGVRSLPENQFATKWITNNPGETQDNQIRLPFDAGLAVNIVIEWGDGTFSLIPKTLLWPEGTHVYAAEGTYEVRISGKTQGWNFWETGEDREKFVEVVNWGDFDFGTECDLYFSGCENLTVSATDTPNLSDTTTMQGTFTMCTSLSEVSSMNDWNTSAVTDMSRLFSGASVFNQDISNWNTSNVIYMYDMFRDASSFNQDISSWDTSSVISLDRMFFYAVAFDQNLSDWDVTSVTGMDGMFSGITLSTANYDAILIGWEAQDVLDGVAFDGGNSQYSAGAPTEARQRLIDDHDWIITDGGQAP